MLIRFSVFVLLSFFVVLSEAKDKVTPPSFTREVNAVIISCIVDIPLGIKRYRIVVTAFEGFKERTMSYCRNEFKRLGSNITKEISLLLPFFIENHVTTSVGNISCEALKMSNMPVTLFAASALDPVFFDPTSTALCLNALREMMKDVQDPYIQPSRKKVLPSSLI